MIKTAQSPDNINTAKANLKVREGIADVIVRYRKILESRYELTERAFERAREDAEVSFQTLKTLETAGELGALVTDSSAEFTALTQFKAPDLLPLDDEKVLEQFLEVSRDLAGS